nr:DUF6515 family protein [uncultured Desulfobulbus sp.]
MRQRTLQTANHQNNRSQTTFLLGIGLVILLAGPTTGAAHPMGAGFGPERAMRCGSDQGPGPLPSLPDKRPPMPEPAKNPLRSVMELPGDAQEVALKTPPIYTSNGLFYLKLGDRYQVLPPPPGALIAQLPKGATTLTVGTETFFSSEGVFYQKAGQDITGYEVVPSPVSPLPLPPPPPPKPAMAAIEPPDMVTIQVHSSADQTTPVVLKRNGRQWIGPKGEVYDRLPTEQELLP